MVATRIPRGDRADRDRVNHQLDPGDGEVFLGRTAPGLSIVAALSAACGFYSGAGPDGKPAGKVTWAIVTTP